MRNVEEMAHKIAARHEAVMRDALYGITGSTTAPSEPLTFDKIARLAVDLRAKVGPTPMFLSSRIFLDDKAITVENAATKYTCAGPGFWARLQHEARTGDQAPSLDHPLLGPMFGIRVHEIDLDEQDSPDRREYLKSIWSDLIETFKVAMTPLPDWIWNAPKFTQHG